MSIRFLAHRLVVDEDEEDCSGWADPCAWNDGESLADACFAVGGREEPPYDEAGRLQSICADTTRSYPIVECVPGCYLYGKGDKRVAVVQRGLGVEGLEEFATGDARGQGLRATDDVPRGTFVIEYTGIAYTSAWTPEGRCSTDKNYVLCCCETHARSGTTVRTVIDATCAGNKSRYINHSCEPNLVVVPVRGRWKTPYLALFARRDIRRGEELSFDYACGDDASLSSTVCLCGSGRCRGYLPEEIRQTDSQTLPEDN